MAVQRRILVTGSQGRLGAYLCREIQRRGWMTIAMRRAAAGQTEECFGEAIVCDLTHLDGIAKVVRESRPTHIIHAAAVSTLHDCYHKPELSRCINVDATARLAEIASECSIPFVLTSTDLVFDGECAPYRPDDARRPLSKYGLTKRDSEIAVASDSRHAIARLPLLFGPRLSAMGSFFDWQLAALKDGSPSLSLFDDEWRTPLSFAAAAWGLVELVESHAGRVWHLGGPERLSRWEMGQRLADWFGVTNPPFLRAKRNDVPGIEPRPKDVSLDSSQWRGAFPGRSQHTWEESLHEMGVPHELSQLPIEKL